MDSQIIRFYKVLQDHQFTEEEMQYMVEGIKAILRDESRENAKKKDVDELRKDIREDIDEFKKDVREDINELRKDVREDINELRKEVKEDIDELRKDVKATEDKIGHVQLSLTETFYQSEEKQSDRFRYVYEKMSDYHRTTISWLVGTSIGVGALIVAAIKLIG